MLKYDFYVLIVVYKQKLNETQTFKTLMLTPSEILKRMKLIVWDNSPSDFISEHALDISQFCGFKYLKSECNEKLSVVYNRVINDELNGNGNGNGNGYFTILDQDTSVPTSFFSEMERAGVDDRLMLPRVVSIKTNNIISPRYQEYSKILYRTRIIKIFENTDKGLFNSTNFFAVGSGLTIPKKLWDKKITFEESLSFYGVDTEFCYRYSLMKSEFYLLNVDFFHDVSDYNQEESLEVKKWRHSKYMEYLNFVLKNRYNLSKFSVYFISKLSFCNFIIKQIYLKCKH